MAVVTQSNASTIATPGLGQRYKLLRRIVDDVFTMTLEGLGLQLARRFQVRMLSPAVTCLVKLAVYSSPARVRSSPRSRRSAIR